MDEEREEEVVKRALHVFSISGDIKGDLVSDRWYKRIVCVFVSSTGCTLEYGYKRVAEILTKLGYHVV